MARAQRDNPDDQFEFVLHTVSRSLARAYNEAFRKLGFSQSHAGVLMQVDWADAHTQTEIARRMGIQKAAAGALIIELEERGLLRRERSAKDGRSIEVTLTASGRRQVKRINDFVAFLGPHLRKGIDEGEMRQALDVLRRVRANVEAMDASDT